MTKNEWLATEVMGWKILNNLDYYFTNLRRDYASFYRHNWEPDKDIAQAFMLLDMFGSVALDKFSKDWEATITIATKGGFCGYSTSPAEAITEAVLQASGYYDYIKAENE